MIGEIKTLHPVFKLAVERILTEMGGKGWDPVIGSGMRTNEQRLEEARCGPCRDEADRQCTTNLGRRVIMCPTGFHATSNELWPKGQRVTREGSEKNGAKRSEPEPTGMPTPLSGPR